MYAKSAVRMLAATLVASVFATVPRAEEPGFKSLFNGKDLTGWKGDRKRWSVEEGAITGRNSADDPLPHNMFLIWQGGQPADFELRLKYRIVGGNSGVQYRSKVLDADKFIVGGYQADIDSNPNYTGMNYDEKGRGILAHRGAKIQIAPDGAKRLVGTFGDKDALQAKIRNEDWNDYVISAKGNHLRHYVNGVLMSEVIDHQKGKAATSGVLAFQVHRGPPMKVQFKDIRIKTLD